MKPWTRWWWQGSAVNESDLLWNLQQYQKAGLGGVEITPIYGVKGTEDRFIPYLSPQWMKALTYTLEQSKKLGLGVDMANGTGWPFGGPWVRDEDAATSLQYTIYSLEGGKKLADKIQFIQPAYIRTTNNTIIKPSQLAYPLLKNINQQALGLDQVQYEQSLPLISVMAYSAGKKPVDLTAMVDREHRLNWKAPAGKWQIIALFRALHGKLVERAAPGGEGYAIDHFSSMATHHYLARFDSAFKGYNLSYLRSFFNDSYEVDDAKGQANWTPDFIREFINRKGYDIRHELPALIGRDSADKNAAVLYDYRSVIDELLLENFTLNWKKWATSKSTMLRNQSHGSPANTLDLYSVVDMPETEGNDILRFKFASSAGNVTGKKLVSAEAATWLNEHFLSNWSDVKKAVDLFFLGGVNHIFYHGTAYSPKSASWPGWLFYAAVHFQPTNPMWKDFHVLNNYVTRVQSFLQTSKADNDILIYYPIADRYSKTGGPFLQHFDGMEKNFEDTDFNHLSEWMIENDYSFDFFSSRQLQQFFFDKKIITPGGQYQTILLPGNSYITAKELTKLIELTKAGATIIAYRDLPKKVPGLSSAVPQQQQVDSILNTLKFTNAGIVKQAIVGKGSILIAEDIAALLEAAKIRKEKLRSTGISFIRKSNQEGTVYFLTNTSGRTYRDWLAFDSSTAGVAAAIFDPMTGGYGLLDKRTNTHGQTEYLIQLENAQAAIVQTYRLKKAGKAFRYYQRSGSARELSNAWTVAFIDGGPALPASLHLERPQLWTTEKDSVLHQFSGTAIYTTTFSKPSDTATHFLLDLGKVHETAEIKLNDKIVTTLIGPIYTVVIPSRDLQTLNKLEVIVSNLMANRIIHMDKHKLPWKIFYNTNMPARKKENTVNGLFDASKWTPLPSGLAGPVSLTPVSNGID
jgi:hypothetical protein